MVNNSQVRQKRGMSLLKPHKWKAPLRNGAMQVKGGAEL